MNLSKAEVIDSHPFVTTRCLLRSWHYTPSCTLVFELPNGWSLPGMYGWPLTQGRPRLEHPWHTPSLLAGLLALARFSMPTSITTDHGSQFESDLWQQLVPPRLNKDTYNGLPPCSQRTCQTFPPPAQGQAHVCHHLHTVDRGPPIVLLGICTCVKEDLEGYTAELVYGTTP